MANLMLMVSHISKLVWILFYGKHDPQHKCGNDVFVFVVIVRSTIVLPLAVTNYNVINNNTDNIAVRYDEEEEQDDDDGDNNGNADKSHITLLAVIYNCINNGNRCDSGNSYNGCDGRYECIKLV